MTPVLVTTLTVFVALIIGVAIGFHARQANNADTEALQIAQSAAAYNNGHRAGWNAGWRESEASRLRAAHTPTDMIDGHLRFRALTSDSTELPQ